MIERKREYLLLECPPPPTPPPDSLERDLSQLDVVWSSKVFSTQSGTVIAKLNLGKYFTK